MTIYSVHPCHLPEMGIGGRPRTLFLSLFLENQFQLTKLLTNFITCLIDSILRYSFAFHIDKKWVDKSLIMEIDTNVLKCHKSSELFSCHIPLKGKFGNFVTMQFSFKCWLFLRYSLKFCLCSLSGVFQNMVMSIVFDSSSQS